MSRTAPRLSAGFPLFLAGTIVFLCITPAQAQWLVRRRSLPVGGPSISYSLNSSLFGFGPRPIVCAPTPIGPVCAPLGAVRGLGLGSTYFPGSLCNRTVFARPPVIINPAPVCYDSTPFVYPSTNLTYFSTSTLGAAPREVNVNTSTYSPSSSLIGPRQPPPPVEASPKKESHVCGIQSVPLGKALSDRAVATALRDFERRGTAGPDSASSTERARPATLGRFEASRLDSALRLGDDAFARGDYRTAHSEYARALDLAHDEPAIRISLGLAQFALGKFADSSKTMQWAAKWSDALDPSSFDLRAAYPKSTLFASHLARLEAFVATHPRNADAQFLLGFVRASTGDKIGAKTALTMYQRMPNANQAVRPFIERVKDLGN